MDNAAELPHNMTKITRREIAMNAGLRALLERLVDYAGLFPPAKLPLEDAIRYYALYKAGSDAWMLGRFICPAARLGELSPLIETHFANGPGPIISALGRGGADVVEFSSGLAADLREIETFRARFGGRAIVDVFEVKVPTSVIEAGGIHEVLRPVCDAGLSVFCEAPSSPPALPARLHSKKPSEPRLGLKLRCGGLEAAAFPSVDAIAQALLAARAAEVPFKATAGLHHPFPRFDKGVNSRMHGFVNVFMSGVLAFEGETDIEVLKDLLNDDDPKHFVFDEHGMTWRNRVFPKDKIAQARREFVLSFGSCSFDEPREDLHSLEWM